MSSRPFFVFICSLLLTLANPFIASAEPRDFEIVTINELSGSKDKEFITYGGREISLIRFPANNVKSINDKAKPRFQFYIQAGLHGNETLPSEFVIWLVERLKLGKSKLSQFSPDLVGFDIVPYANPDGVFESSRYNFRGVNLNRNFAFLWGLSRENPGPVSFSEPETKAIRYVLEQNHYTGAVDIHGYINWVVAPSAPSPSSKSRETVQRHSQFVSMLVREVKKFDSGYELKTAGGLGDGGAFEDWTYWNANTPAFCLEMKSAFRFANEDFRFMTNNNPSVAKSDSFEEYESLLFSVFDKLIMMKSKEVLPSKNLEVQTQLSTSHH